jgi:hypothetical protein
MQTLKTFTVKFDDWYTANYPSAKKNDRKLKKSLADDYQRSLATAEFTKLINYLMYVGAIK